ncbi:FAD-linked oxidoreductase-like protein [Aspergillus ambiguus]|uniref:putative proline oxidase Put1 n=1 Tax=Aspergillus ambiguus TaxID=176160 RepID=UPI003CCE2378
MKVKLLRRPLLYTLPASARHASTSSSTAHHALLTPPQAAPPMRSPMAILPTKTLIRSLLFTSIMASPLLKPCLSVMKYIVGSKSLLLSPARNPILNYLLRTTIYNHFCAGVNEKEVRRTVQDMKSLGFKGVILGYARESIAQLDDSPHVPVEKKQEAAAARAVEEWKQGNLQTLQMIEAGDYLNVKFTGAGPAAVEALTRGDPVPPPAIQQAITAICEATAARQARLWIDAEQQVFQPTIDAWTIDLMRQFNRHGRLVVYNTIQAYLKASTANVQRHLELAAREGWALGIKLVRGAYIAHDLRSRIHDTKLATDRNYDHIVQSLLSRQWPLAAPPSPTPFPTVRLFVASHNAESVRRAYSLARHRTQHGLPTVPVELGQLQGMADENVQSRFLTVPLERLVVHKRSGHYFLDRGNIRFPDLTDKSGLDKAVSAAGLAMGGGLPECGVFAVHFEDEIFRTSVEMQRPVLEVATARVIECYCEMRALQGIHDSLR